LEGRKINAAAITLGAVAPTIVHAREAEEYLVGRVLDEETISKAGELAVRAAIPISDIRASADYRKTIVRVLVKRGLNAISKGRQGQALPENPVLLRDRNGNYYPVRKQRPF